MPLMHIKLVPTLTICVFDNFHGSIKYILYSNIITNYIPCSISTTFIINPIL